MGTLSFLPARARSIVYGVTIVLGLVVAAAEAGFKAIGHPDPMWLAFAAGALVPLSIASGAVALSNVTRKPAEPETEPRHAVDDTPTWDDNLTDGDAGAGMVDSEDQLTDQSGDVKAGL